ncbi:MAG TPA: alpha/beta hydrolase-fold protein, partial [Vicinamibacteria bacterium]|nr:alpha/beta hydrolase-fold protein [Vicinamibacteria bacterium]
GWYTDSATVAKDKYESYLLEELIPHVQSRYRTLEDGYARGVAGLSMGGYGALKLALKHPDEFAFAASMSGALGAAQFTEKDGGGWPLVWESILQAFGPLGSPTREHNDLFGLVKGMSDERVRGLPYLYLDCGTDDGLVRSNLALAGLLTEKRIPHEYRQQPGVHNWELWDKQIREVLELASQKLPRR